MGLRGLGLSVLLFVVGCGPGIYIELPPSLLSTQAIDASSMQISWPAQTGASKYLVGYGTTLTSIVKGDTLSTVVSGLTRNSAYSFWARTLTQAGATAAIDFVTAATPDTFTPKDLSSLALWLRADAHVELTATNHVSRWNDVTGNFVALQDADGARPQWVESEASIGSKPTITFDGTTQVLTMGGNPIENLTDYTIFSVAKFNCSTCTGLIALRGTSTALSQIDFSAGGLRFIVRDSNGVTAQAVTATVPATYVVFRGTRSGDNVTLHMNGTLEGSGSAVFTGTFPVVETRIGGYFADSGALAAVDVAEILIFGEAITGTTADAVETYLMDKYAL